MLYELCETICSAFISKRDFHKSISWALGSSKEQKHILYQHTVMLESDNPTKTESY